MRFTSKCWVAFQEALGTHLSFKFSFHPQTYGQSKRTIQTLEDLLRVSMLNFNGSWQQHLSLLEFSTTIVTTQALVWHCLGIIWQTVLIPILLV